LASPNLKEKASSVSRGSAGIEKSDALAKSRLQLLVPVFNEGENVRVLYRQLEADGVDFQVLRFVYDFPEDTTLPVIEDLQKSDERLDAHLNTKGKGVVNALSAGFESVSTGPVVVLMGDNSDKLSIIPEMVGLWKEGATVVSPSRYMKGGKQIGGGLLKSNLSRLAGLSLKVLGFPTSDPTNNFKLYDGDWLKAQTIESEGGFEVALELCYKAAAQNEKIEQLPTVWQDREEGESKFDLWGWMPHYLRWYSKALSFQLTKPFR